jgi:hypothetical protein
MSIKYDNFDLCLCSEHTYYEWEKKANKCMQCEKPFYKDDVILIKRYKFIHPVTADDHIIECEKLQLCDGYWECYVDEKIHHQFPISWAMIKIE